MMLKLTRASSSLQDAELQIPPWAKAMAKNEEFWQDEWERKKTWTRSNMARAMAAKFSAFPTRTLRLHGLLQIAEGQPTPYQSESEKPHRPERSNLKYLF
jgi:hypothetical protein